MGVGLRLPMRREAFCLHVQLVLFLLSPSSPAATLPSLMASSALPILYALPEICKMNGNFDLLCDFRHLDPVDKSKNDFIRQRQFRGTQFMGQLGSKLF